MELRNKLSLEIEEAAIILQNLAKSLGQDGKFELQLENQEVSLEVGNTLEATLIFSDTRFSIDFNWTKQQTSIPSPKAIQTPKPEKKQAVKATVSTVSSNELANQLAELRAEGLKPRRFKRRMILETTTLPYEGGVWSPAFTLSNTSIWTPVDINNQLENSKWISEEELEALSSENLPRKPRAKTPGVTRDDDMFSSLDEDEKTSKAKESKPVPRKVEREVVRPAGIIGSAAIPKVNLKKEELESAAAEWKEPTVEGNVTDDDWVRPSDVLSKKASSSGIPSPGGSKISAWHEPTSDDNSTDDEWVKPSEILKRKNKPVEESVEKSAHTQDVMKKKNRPPPKPPDDS